MRRFLVLSAAAGLLAVSSVGPVMAKPKAPKAPKAGSASIVSLGGALATGACPTSTTGTKLGEIKIRELRARAEKALGPKFDLKGFHDAVLGQGAVPLDVLDAQINDWIAAEKAKG